MHVTYTFCITKRYIYYIYIYHSSNSRECMGVKGEDLQLHAVYKKPYFLIQVT